MRAISTDPVALSDRQRKTCGACFYGGAGHDTNLIKPLDVAECWAHIMREINWWIAQDKRHEADGASGDLINLVGMEKWASSGAGCLDIKDMGVISNTEADDFELEDSGSDSGADSE